MAIVERHPIGRSGSPGEMDLRGPSRFFDGQVAAQADTGAERGDRERTQRVQYVHGVHHGRALGALINWVEVRGAPGERLEAHLLALMTTLPLTVSGSPCTLADRLS